MDPNRTLGVTEAERVDIVQAVAQRRLRQVEVAR